MASPSRLSGRMARKAKLECLHHFWLHSPGPSSNAPQVIRGYPPRLQEHLLSVDKPNGVHGHARQLPNTTHYRRFQHTRCLPVFRDRILSRRDGFTWNKCDAYDARVGRSERVGVF